MKAEKVKIKTFFEWVFSQTFLLIAHGAVIAAIIIAVYEETHDAVVAFICLSLFMVAVTINGYLFYKKHLTKYNNDLDKLNKEFYGK